MIKLELNTNTSKLLAYFKKEMSVRLQSDRSRAVNSLKWEKVIASHFPKPIAFRIASATVLVIEMDPDAIEGTEKLINRSNASKTEYVS